VSQASARQKPQLQMVSFHQKKRLMISQKRKEVSAKDGFPSNVSRRQTVKAAKEFPPVPTSQYSWIGTATALLGEAPP
jgi:hypothetical protein